MNKNLRTVYEEEYNLMKKQIKVQTVLIGILIVLALISCLYNLKLSKNKELLEEKFVEIENLKFGGNE